MSACQCIEVLRISSYGQQVDDDRVASMRAALSHSEGLRALTFDRVRRATKKDPELTSLMNALLTTHYQEKVPENLDWFERYREGLSVLDGIIPGWWYQFACKKRSWRRSMLIT